MSFNLSYFQGSVFHICLPKQPLEASMVTVPAICKLYMHVPILQYGQTNTLYSSCTQTQFDLPCAISRSTTVSGIKLVEFVGTIVRSSVTLPSDGDADRI